MCRFVCLLHIFCLCIDASCIENKPLFKPGCTKPEAPLRCKKGKCLAHKKARRKPGQDVVMISFAERGEEKSVLSASFLHLKKKKKKSPPHCCSFRPIIGICPSDIWKTHSAVVSLTSAWFYLPRPPLRYSRVQFAFDSRAVIYALRNGRRAAER